MLSFATHIWNFFHSLISSAVQAIGGFFQGLITSIGKMLTAALQWLGSLITTAFSALGNFISQLFAPLIYLVNGIIAFFTGVFTLIGLVFQLLVAVFHLLFSFADGLVSTLAGLSYSNGSPTLPSDVSSAFMQMQPIFKLLQLDNLAYVLHFAIWIFTAWSVVKMLGNFGIGGNE